jgi:hypothetical protein
MPPESNHEILQKELKLCWKYSGKQKSGITSQPSSQNLGRQKRKW